MTEEKFCPIMSRPCDEDPIKDDEDKALVEDNGFVVIGNVPWRNIFPCQREKCMAWNDEGQCSVGALRDDCPHMYEGSFECEKCEKWVPGFCKLIDKEVP